MNYRKELEKALTSGKTTGEIVRAIERIIAKRQKDRELEAKRKLAKLVHDECSELKAEIERISKSLKDTYRKDA